MLKSILLSMACTLMLGSPVHNTPNFAYNGSTSTSVGYAQSTTDYAYYLDDDFNFTNGSATWDKDMQTFMQFTPYNANTLTTSGKQYLTDMYGVNLTSTPYVVEAQLMDINTPVSNYITDLAQVAYLGVPLADINFYIAPIAVMARSGLKVYLQIDSIDVYKYEISSTSTTFTSILQTRFLSAYSISILIASSSPSYFSNNWVCLDFVRLSLYGNPNTTTYNARLPTGFTLCRPFFTYSDPHNQMDYYEQGFKEGTENGYYEGIKAVTNNEQTYTSMFGLFSKAFTGMADFLSIKIFGFFTLGTLFAIPLITTIVVIIFKLLRK